MPSKWVKDRMRNSPGLAKRHCAAMRDQKALYALRRLQAEFERIVGKDWHAACSEHFGVDNTTRGWAIGGLMGAGWQKVEDYMKSVVEGAKQ